MSETTNGTATNARTEDGRFAPGNKGGPGNPFARRTAALRKAAMQQASAQDVAEVMAALKLRPQAGDVAAARLWLAYTVGKPGASADPDTLDAHELAVRRQNVATVDDMNALFEKLPASQMCELAQVVASHVQGHMARALTEGMRRQGEAEEQGQKLVAEKPGPYQALKADWAPDWLRNGRGLPDELAKVFETCPAYMPDVLGRDKVGQSYADMLRAMRGSLLGLPGGVKEGNDCRLVPPADDERHHRPGGKSEAGRNGSATRMVGTHRR